MRLNDQEATTLAKFNKTSVWASNEVYRGIWNSAIEAAALVVQPNPHIDEERECQEVARQIRALKKEG